MIEKTLACAGRPVKRKLVNFVKSINTDNFEQFASMVSLSRKHSTKTLKERMQLSQSFMSTVKSS